MNRRAFLRRLTVGVAASSMLWEALAAREPFVSEQSRAGWYNVRDYGAKGDGWHDDSGAFRRAIAAAHRDGGGVVQVPHGHYNIGHSPVELESNVWLQGNYSELRTTSPVAIRFRPDVQRATLTDVYVKTRAAS